MNVTTSIRTEQNGECVSLWIDVAVDGEKQASHMLIDVPVTLEGALHDVIDGRRSLMDLRAELVAVRR